MSMRWLEEKVQVLGAPGQIGMTPAEWQWWNTSGRWFISVLDQSTAFPEQSGDPSPLNRYYQESFPQHGIWEPPGGFTLTALRWVGMQHLKMLYQEWAKKISKPIKVCAVEVVGDGPFKEKYWCFDGNTVTEITKTGTQIKTTCPPNYVKIVHPDGSFGCVAPYVPGPADFSGQTKTFSTTTPRGYRQPVTTVAPMTVPSGYRPPTFVRGVPGTLGALPDADVAMAKAILAAWNGTDGNNSIGSYGLQPADISLVWGDRDGWTLANFYNWWNKSGWAPPLPNPTTKNEIAWQDLTTQGLYSLKVWAQAKGITIVPGQLPNPGFPSAPAPSAPVPSAPTPQVPLPRVPTPVPGNPSDVTQCDPGFHWDPVSKLCVVTPLPIPPTPIPGGGTPPSSEGGGNTGILIAVGALALLGLGAAIFGGGSGGATAATPKRPAARSNPSNDNAFWSGWFKKSPIDTAAEGQQNVYSIEEIDRLHDTGVFFVYDKHDGTVYRVSHAPSQKAAFNFIARKLHRRNGEGVRDLGQGPVKQEHQVHVRYASIGRSAQKRKKRSRRR